MLNPGLAIVKRYESLTGKYHLLTWLLSLFKLPVDLKR